MCKNKEPLFMICKVSVIVVLNSARHLSNNNFPTFIYFALLPKTFSQLLTMCGYRIFITLARKCRRHWDFRSTSRRCTGAFLKIETDVIQTLHSLK